MLVPAGLSYFTNPFHAIGSTAAVDLTRHCPPAEDGPTKILLLGCGDLRHLLFTLHNQRGTDFHFTICDQEPAVLARNILILTFIIDHEPESADPLTDCLDAVFDFWYHLILHQQRIQQLQQHARNLAAHSASPQAWRASPYSSAIRYVNTDTLAQLRSLWRLYGDGHDYSFSSDFSKSFLDRSAVRPDEQPVSAGRSFGLHSAQLGPVCSTLAAAYKRKGTTPVSNLPPTAQMGKDMLYLNPSLAFSSVKGDKFALSAATDFMAGFHLAAAACDGTSTNDVTVSIVQTVRSQFRDRLAAFIEAFRLRKVKIYVHWGEGLALAHAFYRMTTGRAHRMHYLSHLAIPFSGKTLALNETHYKKFQGFHVIDTSSLMESVGLLRLLPTLVPLLHQCAPSVLYTESMEERSGETSLQQSLRSDITTACVLMGITLNGSVLGHDVTSYDTGTTKLEKRQSQITTLVRLVWRLQQHPPGQITIAHQSLSKALIQWHDKMLFDRVVRQTPTSGNAGSADILPKQDDCEYSAADYIGLLVFLKCRIDTDWPACIRKVHAHVLEVNAARKIEHKTHEFLVHLHASGLYRDESVFPSIGPDADLATFPGNVGVAANVAAEPGLVRLVLTMPGIVAEHFISRVYLHRGAGSKKRTMHVVINSPNHFEHWFTAIDLYVGWRSHVHRPYCHQSSHQSSAEAWEEKLLTVVCHVPWSVITTEHAKTTTVALVLEPSEPLDSASSRHIYVNTRNVFRIGLLNTANVGILPSLTSGCPMFPVGSGSQSDPPHMVSSSDIAESSLASTRDIGGSSITVSIKNGKVTSILIKFRVDGPFETDEVLDKDAALMSPTVAMLIWRGKVLTASFPCPVRLPKLKTGLEDGVYCVAVRATPCSVPESPGLTVSPFGLPSESRLQAPCLGRIDLNLQPPIDASKFAEEIIWAAIPSMALTTPSDNLDKSVSPLSQFVRSLLHLIGDYCFHAEHSETIDPVAVIFDQEAQIDTIFIIVDLLQDLEGGGIIMHGYVIEVEEDNRHELQSAFCDDGSFAGVTTITAPGQTAECKAVWDKLWPVAADRCRRTWSHLATCEHAVPPKPGSRPENPHLCSCAKGKDTLDLPDALAAFAHLAVRVAVSPLYPAPELHGTNYAAKLDRQRTRALIEMDASFFRRRCAHCGRKEGMERREEREEREGEAGGAGAGGPMRLVRCARCGVHGYCGRECQRASWKAHRLLCSVMADIRAEGGGSG